MTKRVFQILDELNVNDAETGSRHLQLCGNDNVISIEKKKNHGEVKFAIPVELAAELCLSNKDYRLMLVVIDGKEYDKLKQ